MNGKNFFYLISNFSETYVGVKDMSCDTFAKIVSKCRKMFATRSLDEQPYLFDIVSKIPDIIDELADHQKISFFTTLSLIYHEYQLLYNITDDDDCYGEIVFNPYISEIIEATDNVCTGDETIIKNILMRPAILHRLAFNLNILYSFGKKAGFPLNLVICFGCVRFYMIYL